MSSHEGWDRSQRRQLSAGCSREGLLQNLSQKIRRTAEPDFQPCVTGVLDRPWDITESDGERRLSQPILYALREVFHFTHATAVQSAAHAALSTEGLSAVIEAPTGSGKTLAFLIPIFERALDYSDKEVKAHGVPRLSRRIFAIVLSPSRVLARQTLSVARLLFSRSSRTLRAELCDLSAQSLTDVLHHLNHSPRTASGTILFGTPSDVEVLCNALQSDAVPCYSQSSADHLQQQRCVRFTPLPGEDRPSVCVIDEADIVLRCTETMQKRVRFLISAMRGDNQRGAVDVWFVGATVNMEPLPIADELLGLNQGETMDKEVSNDVSSHVTSIVQNIPSSNRSCQRIVVGNDHHFLSQLQTRAIFVDPPSQLLPTLVALLLAKPSQKHLVFFNDAPVLLFFEALIQSLRDILPIDVFAVHERQRDVKNLNSFELFLHHNPEACRDKFERNVLESRGQFGTRVTANGTAAPAASDAAASRKRRRQRRSINTDTNQNQRRRLPIGAVLLCTDMAAFGLDMRDVDKVYHAQIPHGPRAYCHRVGRVARMGLRGTSVLLIPSPQGSTIAERIQRDLLHPCEPMRLPRTVQIIAPRVRSACQSLPESIREDAICAFQQCVEWMDPDVMREIFG